MKEGMKRQGGRKEATKVPAEKQSDKEHWASVFHNIERDQEGVADKPRIHASEFGAKEISKLSDGISNHEVENPRPQIVAVVRCWNKSEQDIKDLRSRIDQFRAHIPDITGVLVVINKEKESGVTEAAVIATEQEGSVPFAPLTIENYTWTSGLNGASAVLNEMCIEKKIPLDHLRVMNLSFDVDLDANELEKIREQIETNEFIFTARRPSQGTSSIENARNERDASTDLQAKAGGDSLQEGLWKKLTDMMRQPHSAELSRLAYVMRNTFNIIPLSRIVEMGGFNPLTNGAVREFSPAAPDLKFFQGYEAKDMKVSVQGMEDIEFFMRMLKKALVEEKPSVLKAFKASFLNPVMYSDQSWLNLSEEDKLQKMSNEMRALSLILTGLAAGENVVSNGSVKRVGLDSKLRVPPAMADFTLRKSNPNEI